MCMNICLCVNIWLWIFMLIYKFCRPLEDFNTVSDHNILWDLYILYMMSTNHSFHKSTKCLYQISRVQKHHQHSCFKKLKMSRSNSRHSPPRQPILRVLIDMDGVLCDFEQSFLDKFRERHPDEPYIPLSERKGFYIDEQYAKMKPNLQVSFMTGPFEQFVLALIVKKCCFCVK